MIIWHKLGYVFWFCVLHFSTASLWICKVTKGERECEESKDPLECYRDANLNRYRSCHVKCHEVPQHVFLDCRNVCHAYLNTHCTNTTTTIQMPDMTSTDIMESSAHSGTNRNEGTFTFGPGTLPSMEISALNDTNSNEKSLKVEPGTLPPVSVVAIVVSVLAAVALGIIFFLKCTQIGKNILERCSCCLRHGSVQKSGTASRTESGYVSIPIEDLTGNLEERSDPEPADESEVSNADIGEASLISVDLGNSSEQGNVAENEAEGVAAESEDSNLANDDPEPDGDADGIQESDVYNSESDEIAVDSAGAENVIDSNPAPLIRTMNGVLAAAETTPQQATEYQPDAKLEQSPK